MRCLILVLFLTLTPAQGFADVAFISAGQSNAGGRGLIAEAPEELRQIPANVAYWRNGVRRYDLDGLEWFGPELSLMQRLSAEHPYETVYFVQYFVGGSKIDRWLPYGDIYPGFTKAVDQAIDGAPVKGLFWTQGERDALAPQLAVSYGRKLRAFHARLQEALGQEFPLFYATLNSHYPYASVVQQHQIDAGKNASMFPVSTLGLTKRPDNVHYDTAGQIELGGRYFEAYNYRMITGR